MLLAQSMIKISSPAKLLGSARVAQSSHGSVTSRSILSDNRTRPFVPALLAASLSTTSPPLWGTARKARNAQVLAYTSDTATLVKGPTPMELFRAHLGRIRA